MAVVFTRFKSVGLLSVAHFGGKGALDIPQKFGVAEAPSSSNGSRFLRIIVSHS